MAPAELNLPRPHRQAAAPYPRGDTGASMDRLVNWVAQRGPGDRNFPDLSHGAPGHLCVLPGHGERQAEAGS